MDIRLAIQGNGRTPSAMHLTGMPFIVLVMGMILLSGCATYKQVQFFEVLSPPDPETGVATRNFYKMTASGSGLFVSKYKMNAAYLSTAAIDVLRGVDVSILSIELSPKNQTIFDEIKQMYLEALKAYAANQATLSSGSISAIEHEALMTQVARQLWLASLSDEDLQSFGQIQSSDPYAFRKLVFYTSAEEIDLEKLGGKIDGIVKNARTLSEQFKLRKEAEIREQQARREQQKEILKQAVKAMSLSEEQRLLFFSILSIPNDSAPSGDHQ